MKLKKDKPLIGNRIGIFGKGGSGKSTIAALLSQALAREGYQVVLIDADSTNIGLSQVLGFEKPPKPLLEYFGGMVFSGGKVTCPVDDPTLLENSIISIDMLPKNYYVQGNGVTFLIAGKIGDIGPGAGCDGPVAKIARDFRILFKKKPVVTLVDFKAGFEDSARGAITSLDWAIVIVDPTIAAIEMASSMKSLVEQIRAGKLPATMHLENNNLVSLANSLYRDARIKGVLVILNKIDGSDMENLIRVELLKRGIDPIGVVHENASISISWLKGLSLELSNSNRDIEIIVNAIQAQEAIKEIEKT
ncbi:P-loop NTPase [Chloroflexota bacterium]